tara:strand:- start:965 stop:1141 length:177 start_codon:yes stop_codon:yes gene_type:complete
LPRGTKILATLGPATDKLGVLESILETGDLVVLTKGMYRDKSGGTSMMKILRVGGANY